MTLSSSIRAPGLLTRLALLLVLTVAVAPARDARHPRDLLAEALAPILTSVASDTTTGHDGMDARFLARPLATDGSTDPESAAYAVRLLFDAPSRCIVEITNPNSRFVLARSGQSLWAAPRDIVQPLLEPWISTPHENPSADRLPPMTLPLDSVALTLLPAFLDALDHGDEIIQGIPCRIVEARPTQELLDQFPAARDWRLITWIAGEPARLVRLKVVGPPGGLLLDVRSLKTSLVLPDHLWSMPIDKDAMPIPTTAFLSLWQSLVAPSP